VRGLAHTFVCPKLDHQSNGQVRERDGTQEVGRHFLIMRGGF
jgi:hypothetical protein